MNAEYNGTKGCAPVLADIEEMMDGVNARVFSSSK
jgi:hypothetical protein